MPRLGRGGQRLEARKGKLGQGARGSRHGLLAFRQRLGQAGALVTGEPHATIILKLDFDGGITILTGASDIGQGSSTIITQVVAEVLGVDHRRRVIANDSAITPKDNGSYSSRVTFMVGNAAADAARSSRRILVKAAARRLKVAPKPRSTGSARARQSLRSDPHILRRDRRGGAGRHRHADGQGHLHLPAEFQGGKQRGGAVGSTMGFSYAAQAVEVSVDLDLGKVTVDKVWAAVDCGFAHQPDVGRRPGAGRDLDGHGPGHVRGDGLRERPPHAAANMLDYRVPTIVESPDIEVHIVESIDPNGPFGAKEASEGPLSGFLSALAAAVEDATGQRSACCRSRPKSGLRVRSANPNRRAPTRRSRNERLPDFQYCASGHRRRCRAPARRHPASRFIAGGTDLLPNMRRGLVTPTP
jgi:4-hydroxybenzoyl-CoA reductase subunit alpha